MVDQFSSQRNLDDISSYKLCQYYHGLLETASSWIQPFEIFDLWSSIFGEINTTLYLVHRAKHNRPPLRLAITLSLTIERVSGFPSFDLGTFMLPSG